MLKSPLSTVMSDRARRLIWGSMDLLLAILCFVILLGPFLTPGAAAASPYLPEEPVDDCVDSPSRPLSQDPTVVGTVRQGPNRTVEISYRSVGERRSPPTVIRLPYRSELLDTRGFERVPGSRPSLVWERNATEHWLRYRMSSKGVRFPGGEDWLISAPPEHEGEGVRVTLRFESSGVVGSHFLYVGNYTTMSASEGCQTVTAVVPATTPPDQRATVRARLHALSEASRSLPVGRWYERVRIFVSPVRLGSNLAGFAPGPENEFVISTGGPDRAASWIHEYVHTTQSFATESQGEQSWIIEASATYLSHRIALEQGLTRPSKYDRWLFESERRNWTGSLTTARHDHRIAYVRGAIVLANIDAQLHEHGNGSVVDLIRFLNRRGDVSTELLISYLDEHGLNSSERSSVNQSIRSHEPIEVPYVIGPQWLPLLEGWPIETDSHWRIVYGVVGLASMGNVARKIAGR